MAEEKHCSECGAELPADTPQGLCPQCLMKLGLPFGIWTLVVMSHIKTQAAFAKQKQHAY